jgi:hypothetical protein
VRLPAVVPGESEYLRQEKLFSFAQSLSPAEIPAALHEALYFPVSQRNLALSVLMGRWAEVDPAGAVKYTMELPFSAEPSQLREKALSRWAAKDFDGALAWTLSQKRTEVRYACLATLACSLAEIDPKRALEFVATHAKTGEAMTAYSRLYGLWAEKDYAAALASAQSAEPRFCSSLIATILEKRAEKEPREVLETIKALRNLSFATPAAQTALATWMKRDPTSAREWILKLGRGNLRRTAIYQSLQVAGPRDAQETRRWASENLKGKELETALDTIFLFAAREDVEAALSDARVLPEGSARTSSLTAVTKCLADADPERALKLADELPEGAARASAVSYVCQVWAQRDPRAAAQWAFDHLPAEADGLGNIMEYWQTTDVSGAFHWLESLPSNARKNHLISSTLFSLMYYNTESAPTEFAKLQPDSQRAGAESFSRVWMSRDPEAALEWTTAISDDETRANAIKGAISSWGYYHAEDAAKWVNELPAGLDRDVAAQSFATTVVEKDARGAIEWASSIADDLRRENALRQVLTSWIGRDKAAATDWLATDTGLPETLRSELQRTAAVAQ